MAKRTTPKIGNYNKIDVVSFVKMKLKSNDDWVKRACELLYQQQSKSEKRAHLSLVHDTWGFNRNDAPHLSQLACRIRQHRLTNEDVRVLHIKIPKYAKQLICLAYEKDKGKKLKTHLDYYYKDKQSRLPF